MAQQMSLDLVMPSQATLIEGGLCSWSVAVTVQVALVTAKLREKRNVCSEYCN